jgi:hypothetical protein
LMDSTVSTDYLLYQLDLHQFTNINYSEHYNHLGIPYKYITFNYQKNYGYIQLYNPKFIKVNINNHLANIHDNIQSAINQLKSLTLR